MGHVPCTYDYHPGDIGIYHNSGTPEKPGRDYVFSSPDPLWPFGFGLSYTHFAYSDLKIDNPDVPIHGEMVFRFTVSNTGQRTGKEVAQVYYNDEISSSTTPVKRLIRFAKIELAPGESREVSFTIKTTELAVWNRAMKRVVEPGAFTLMVGASSADIRLRDRFFVDALELLKRHKQQVAAIQAQLGLAIHKRAWASSELDSHPASSITDTWKKERWAASGAGREWIAIDLGVNQSLGRMKIV